MIRFDDVEVGDPVAPLVKPAISRLQLALYASAGADHNPIHQDDEAARAGGLPGVIAHGMLPLGFLGQMLGRWVPQRQIRSLSARFVAMSFPGDVLTCTGTVVEKRTEGAVKLVDLDLAVLNQRGEKVQLGKATVALP